MRYTKITIGLNVLGGLCGLGLAIFASGCSAIQGERFWWDDQKQTKLNDEYSLPEWPPETPLAPGEKIFVDKKLPANEPERAKAEELKQIAAGIPRTGVPDPFADPVRVPVGVWGSYDASSESDSANFAVDSADAAPKTDSASDAAADNSSSSADD